MSITKFLSYNTLISLSQLYSNKPAGQQHGNWNKQPKMFSTSSAYHFTASLIWVLLYAVLWSKCWIQTCTVVWHTSAQGSVLSIMYITSPGQWRWAVQDLRWQAIKQPKSWKKSRGTMTDYLILRGINVQWIHRSRFFILGWVLFWDYSCVLLSKSGTKWDITWKWCNV